MKSLSILTLFVLLALQAPLSGGENYFPLWTPAFQTCRGGGSSYLPGHEVVTASDYVAIAMFQGGWCNTEVRVKPGAAVSRERGQAIVEEILPVALRGVLELGTVTVSGCNAFQQETYADFAITMTLNECGGKGAIFKGARISARKLVF